MRGNERQDFGKTSIRKLFKEFWCEGKIEMNKSLGREWGQERGCVLFPIVWKIKQRMAYVHVDGNDPEERGELLEG